jgi:hypothetical protein
MAFTLLAKAMVSQRPGQAQRSIQTAAIYATSRAQLKLLLDNKWPRLQQAEVHTTATAAPAIAPKDLPTDNPPSTTPSSLAANLIRTPDHNTKAQPTGRVAKNNVEQLHIIESFIKKGNQPRQVTIKEVSLTEPSVDLTQESTTLHHELFTKSLAKIMLQQGKVECAAEIYRHLQIKLPEEEAYLATIAEKNKHI